MKINFNITDFFAQYYRIFVFDFTLYFFFDAKVNDFMTFNTKSNWGYHCFVITFCCLVQLVPGRS